MPSHPGTPPAPPARRPRTTSEGGRQLAPCGTRSAYERHRRNGEIADRACLAAEAAYRRHYHHARRAA